MNTTSARRLFAAGAGTAAVILALAVALAPPATAGPLSKNFESGGSSAGNSLAACDTAPAGEEGWATVAGATYGGACGTTVTVTSLSQLQTEANKKVTAETILVDGLFTGSGEITVRDNKSIIGVGANSGLVGIGLSIEHLHPANVVVRNLHISGVTADSGDGDAIHIQDADHIWIDHNTLSSDLDHGVDYYDGLLDATHASDYITASWNHLATHIKGSLLGHDDDNAAEDTGHLRVTYHHNWFDRTMERNPRIRFGDPVHIYDNYYSNITGSDDYYGIASTQDGGALVEDNVFENVVQACWSASGYADSGPGRLVARDNQLINSGPCETNGTVAAIPYAYALEDVGTVKASVTTGAGAGHL
jgi:pectate lyase